MAPPSRTTFSSFAESYYPTTVQFRLDVHQFDDVIDDKMNIDSTTASSSNQYEEKIDVPSSSSSSSLSSSSTATVYSPSATRSTNRSIRRPKSSSYTLYKHSLPHRRRHLFRRSSFHPQLPHAFAQPSTYRYTPYIPISVTGGGHSDSNEFRDGYITAAPSTTTTASLNNDNSGDMESECDGESIIGV